MPVRRLNVTVGRIGNGVQIPDRTAAVMPSDAQDAIGSIPRRPRRRDEAQSEDLPAERVSNLRPKERYVPDVRGCGACPAGGACNAA